MTRRCRFLHALIGSPSAHRALDETLLDIRAEGVNARRPWERVLWFGRSTTALLRVAIRIAPLDLRALAPGGWMIRTALWAALLVVPMIGDVWMRLADQTRAFDASTQALLVVALVPGTLALVLPVALFFAAIWPPRRSSSPAAVQAVIAAALVLLVLVITPAANQTFRSVSYSTLNGTTASWNVPPPGLNELALATVIRHAFSGEGGGHQVWQARQLLLSRAELVALAGALALLGALVRRTRSSAPQLRRRVWPYAVGVPPLMLAATWLGGPWGLLAAAAVALGLAVRLALYPIASASDSNVMSSMA